jgi:hypothetical protein
MPHRHTHVQVCRNGKADGHGKDGGSVEGNQATVASNNPLPASNSGHTASPPPPQRRPTTLLATSQGTKGTVIIVPESDDSSDSDE